MEVFMTCARKYRMQIVDGWVPKKMAPALEFGILFHACMEYHSKLIASGVEHKDALPKVVKFALVKSEGFKGDEDGKQHRTRFTLVRSVVWYFDHFRHDAFATYRKKDGSAAVELSFRVAIPLTGPDGEPYLLCGHIDRVIETATGEVMISDYKTTAYTLSSNWFEKFSPNWQMSNYIFGATVDLPTPPTGAIIDAAQLAKGFNRFGRGKTERTPDQQEEWLNDTQEWIRLAEYFSDRDYWPMNLSSCGNYGGCMFRGVCSRDPSVRETWLKSDFKQERWNPLRNRGD